MTDELLLQAFNVIVKSGGKPYIVGGYVRDLMLGLKPKDIDIEVFGLSYDQLSNILSQFGKVDIVGKSFGVLKLTTNQGDFDFSLPRRDSKNGIGHQDFIIEVDHTMTIKEAAARRDFTINSMSFDHNYNFVDPFDGLIDLQAKILDNTSEHFSEDPLRVLRGFQFAGRFKMFASEKLIKECKKIADQYNSLPKERVFGEWYKWAEKSERPSFGLRYLHDVGWLKHYPEINVLIRLPQDPEWHPEGNVFTHTNYVIDAAAEICSRDNIVGENRVIIVLAALCHDFGKANTTAFIEGRWRSPGHDKTGMEIARNFLESIGCFPSLIERIVPLVGEHMIHIGEINERVVKRLSVRLGEASIKDLLALIEADHSGRPPLPRGLPENANRLSEVSALLKLEASKPQPIILGRHLIRLGRAPGKDFGPLLKEMFERQLDGEFDGEEEGIVLLKNLLERHNG